MTHDTIGTQRCGAGGLGGSRFLEIVGLNRCSSIFIVQCTNWSFYIAKPFNANDFQLQIRNRYLDEPQPVEFKSRNKISFAVARKEKIKGTPQRCERNLDGSLRTPIATKPNAPLTRRHHRGWAADCPRRGRRCAVHARGCQAPELWNHVPVSSCSKQGGSASGHA